MSATRFRAWFRAWRRAFPSASAPPRVAGGRIPERTLVRRVPTAQVCRGRPRAGPPGPPPAADPHLGGRFPWPVLPRAVALWLLRSRRPPVGSCRTLPKSRCLRPGFSQPRGSCEVAFYGVLMLQYMPQKPDLGGRIFEQKRPAGVMVPHRGCIFWTVPLALLQAGRCRRPGREASALSVRPVPHSCPPSRFGEIFLLRLCGKNLPP